MKPLLYIYSHVLALWTAYLIFLGKYVNPWYYVGAFICIIVLVLIYNRIKLL